MYDLSFNHSNIVCPETNQYGEQKTVVLVAETTFTGWENFGTKDQVYRNPQKLEKIYSGGYLLDGNVISNDEAEAFIEGCEIEIKHGSGNAVIHVTTFEKLFAEYGIV
jgi:hypothetical protein